jgi:L-malate glycosyltransferase
MNILHLHTNLNLTCGISKTIYLIAKYPVEGNKHFVVALSGDAGKKFEESKIIVKFLKNNKTKILKEFNVIFYLRRFIRVNNIDIVHSHHRYFDFIAYLLSFFCKIKRVTSVQSFVYGKKLLSYKSPVLLAAGDSVKEHLIEYFDISGKRIIVFNNFVDLSESMVKRTPEEIKRELKIPAGSYIIGYVGRFSIKEKGIDILTEAFKSFCGKNGNTYLVMIGEGEDIKKIKLQSNVKILSPKDNIFDYYPVFDCIVLPSRIDPFPLTVLEAGMMKVPFIGSNVNGIGEIIKDGIDGLLFNKDNEAMLLEKIQTFFNDRNYAEECSDKLYEKIIKRYSCTTSVEFLNCIYEKL